MTIFSCNNISKSYAGVLLFEDVSFGMTAGEKAGLIGKNGAGKTTLLDIVAGEEIADTGEIIFNKKVTLDYLKQNPKFTSYDLVLDSAMSGRGKVYDALLEHKALCDKMQKSKDERLERRIQELNEFIENEKGWTLENQAKSFLSRLGVTDFHAPVNTLSGGQRKRAALARALISKPDLLILDEPTNHLDADAIQWLQDELIASNKSLLFVTHDRYFLDAVSTKIVELNRKKLFVFPGDYETYLRGKSVREQVRESTLGRTQARLRDDLQWLQKGARARRKKQQSKLDWIEDLKKKSFRPKEKKIEIELGSTFLGKRIVEAYYIDKALGGKTLFKDFNYFAKPGDRIGVIGPNGSGKTTLLNVLCGRMKPDEGEVKIGKTVKFGFFEQEVRDLKDSQTVIGALKEVAEYINVGEGRDRYISARELLERFLFTPQRQKSFVGTLSGGEKRRLALLRVLMRNPNVLLLDEPTNDFDIPTLKAFESYLDDFYGVLITVSHDRAFLDRTINFIWAFDSMGNIKEYPGDYSYYLEKLEERKAKRPAKKKSKKNGRRKRRKSNKLSYKDKLRYEGLEKEIEELESRKSELQSLINSGEIQDFKELNEKSAELAELEEIIDEKMLEWMEIGDGGE